MRQCRPDMQGEGGVGQRVAEQSLFHHDPGAVMPLLSRLEHEQDAAGDFFPPGAENPGCAGQHRRMAVMPAGMHLARLAAGEVEAGRLLDRKRVHVSAQPVRFAPDGRLPVPQ